MKNVRLRSGEVDLHRRRQYWEHFEREKIVKAARRHADFQNGIALACHLLVDQLKDDAQSLEWAKEQAAYFNRNPYMLPGDMAQEYYDREAPKALKEYMDEGRKLGKVVREDENGPYKRRVWFCGS